MALRRVATGRYVSADERYFVERVKWSGQPIFWMVVDYDNSREVSRHASLEEAAWSIGDTLGGEGTVTDE